MPPEDNNVKTTLRLKGSLIEALDREAARRGFSRSLLIRLILADVMAGRPVQIGE